MAKPNSTDHWLNPQTAAITIGLGVLLAPFTGGASLIQVASTVGIAAAIKAAEDKKPKS